MVKENPYYTKENLAKVAGVGGGVWYGSKKIREGLEDAPDGAFAETLKVVFDGTKDGGKSAGISGAANFAIGQASTSLVSRGTQAIGHRAAYEIASHGRRITNGARVLMRTGKVISFGQGLYEAYNQVADDCKDLDHAIKVACAYFHGKHRDQGRYYDSECPVCKGDI